jgi:LuxR family maltose regulon positive regulatory protein
VSSPLLKTKLYAPSVPHNLVSRSHLVQRLNDGLRRGRKLTVLSAPAGYGKTTLLSEWVHSNKGSAAWLSLERAENDLPRFLSYLVAALQPILPRLGEDPSAGMSLPQRPSIEAVLTVLINHLVDLSLEDETTARLLVLDDYHLISAEPVHDAVAFLLDHLPPPPQGLHLVIATRADPPLPLVRMRARGELAELRLIDLRFSVDESAAFLRRTAAAALEADEIATLAARTEGWPAGLQMAALSMRGQVDAHYFVRAFDGSDRYILDYLVEEVLRRQPAHIRAFLLQTSILSRLSGPLCDAVVAAGAAGERDGRMDTPADLPPSSATGQQTLEYLERTNLFLVPLDNRREWYRYHQLFADLMQVRLEQTQPDRVPELHRRASQWHERNGRTETAIEHALSAGDADRAAGLVAQVAEAMLMRAELGTILGWLERLPRELIYARPSLALAFGWALVLAGRPLVETESLLSHAAMKDQGITAGVIALRALIAALRLDGSRALQLSHQALARLPEEDRFSRSFVAWILSTIKLSLTDLEGGAQAVSRLLEMGQDTGNQMVLVAALCQVAEEFMRQGELHRAHELYGRALEAATPHADLPGQQRDALPLRSEALKGLAELAREWNDLDVAARYVEEALALGEQWSDMSLIESYLILARIRQAQARADQALQALEEAWQLAVRFDTTELDDLLVAMTRARLWIAQGNLAAAQRWAEEAQLDRWAKRLAPDGAAPDAPLSDRVRKYECLVYARLLIAQGRPNKALPVLGAILPIADRRKRTGIKIEVHLLSALALQAKGETKAALAALADALSLAEPERYMRIFLDEGSPMRSLLAKAVARGNVPAYAQQLLEAFEGNAMDHGLHAGEHPSPLDEPPPSSLIEPLSERELEVLRWLTSDLTSTEIADALCVSVNTLRTHIKHIYAKLDVHRRYQAIDRAKELGLL